MTARKPSLYCSKDSRFRPAVFAVLILLSLLLAGCSSGGQSGETVPTKASEPFRPATSASETPTTAVQTKETAKPKSNPSCLDNLTWVSDQSIPDGSEVAAQSTLDKRWEVKNSGNCNWDEHYRLRLTAGPGMNAAQEQMLFPARAGTTVTIRVVFQAPSKPGNYRSAWQAYNPDGHSFGDPIFIDVVVK